MSRSACLLLLGFLLPLLPCESKAAVTEAQVKDVAKELACLCDTCPRRPLHECACGWADKNRKRISDALESGQDKDVIVAGFIKDFGLEALSAPPMEGFHLTAWVMPFAVLIAGGFVVRLVVLNWSRGRSKTAPRQQSGGQGEDKYRSRLEDELRKFDA